jgi:hypothetical protein
MRTMAAERRIVIQIGLTKKVKNAVLNKHEGDKIALILNKWNNTLDDLMDDPGCGLFNILS